MLMSAGEMAERAVILANKLGIKVRLSNEGIDLY